VCGNDSQLCSRRATMTRTTLSSAPEFNHPDPASSSPGSCAMARVGDFQTHLPPVGRHFTATDIWSLPARFGITSPPFAGPPKETLPGRQSLKWLWKHLFSVVDNKVPKAWSGPYPLQWERDRQATQQAGEDFWGSGQIHGRCTFGDQNSSSS
jgi:hypothetical protein